MATPDDSQSGSLNPDLHGRLRRGATALPAPAAWAQAIRAGDRGLLSRGITLLESTLPAHRERATALVEACLPYAGDTLRVGITGSPGVGKSTFIENMGGYLLDRGHRVAVLAVDPSSERTGGSILGDKTRMPQLTAHPAAYVRPSPAGTTLGGVTRYTREAITLCEAAGYDLILVETVGVGQSETAVYHLTDCFALLLLPGAGDELQGIKRGIVEMADLVWINKAEGDRAQAAKETQRAYRNALHLFPPKESNWTVPVLRGSALEGLHLDAWYQALQQFRKHVRSNGHYQRRRAAQRRTGFRHALRDELWDWLRARPGYAERLATLEPAVVAGERSVAGAVRALLDGL